MVHQGERIMGYSCREEKDYVVSQRTHYGLDCRKGRHKMTASEEAREATPREDVGSVCWIHPNACSLVTQASMYH